MLQTANSPHPCPLVVMLHGAGGNAEFAIEETGWSRLAEAEQFTVVYPEGLPVRLDKPSKFLTNPQEWHDGSGRGRHDDVGFLAAVLDRLAERVDTNRVYVAGFSNGAGMCFRFAAEQGERLAAIAPMAGHCWIEPKPVRALPTLYIAGDADPLVPIEGGSVRTPWGKTEHRPSVHETVSRWSQAIGIEAGSDFFPVDIVPNQGHHWPGGSGLLGERIGGPISTRLDATRHIWAFFQRHSRLGAMIGGGLS